MSNSNESNYYEVLEVAQDAPQHEIHEAFQRAKRTYSVDSAALYSMFSQEEAQQLMKLIEEAFAVLGNQTLRRAYDEKLKFKKSWNGEDEMPLDSAIEAPESMTTPDWSAPLEASAPQPQVSTSEPVSQITWGDSSQPPPKPITSSENMGKTKLSCYEVNENFEEEFLNQSVFDGPLLQSIREYKNVSEAQMCDATKIGRNYIRAVETNNYSDLPAPVFVRGFIIQIARILDLDEKKVSSSYMQLLKETNKS